MRYFAYLMIACATSVLAYLFLFGFVVSRPLVVDQIASFMEHKLAYAAATPHPKIFIIAGSNARFSHSCAVLEQVLQRPCVNMGIAADVSLDWMFDKVRPKLRKADLVYLPIEYDFYARSRVQALTGIDAAYRFRHDKTSLASRGLEGIARAAFMFSLPTLIQSVGEMTLNAAGVHRRFGLDTMDRQGDEISHDGKKALAYRDVVLNAPGPFPNPATFMGDTNGSQAMIAAFLEWCRDHGVIAVGGLPTVFNDRPIPPDAIAKLRDFYARHGATFVVLDNRSQYPRADFYDTGYHLRQSMQMVHSRLLADKLGPLLPR